jgi:hypothetical protein
MASYPRPLLTERRGWATASGGEAEEQQGEIIQSSKKAPRQSLKAKRVVRSTAASTPGTFIAC